MESEEPKKEEEKSPEELLLEEIYDKDKPKQERAQLIKDKLRDDRDTFYELDFFLKNYYYHIVENFSGQGDEELFKDLTLTVLRDIKKSKDESGHFYADIKGNKIDLFDTTFNGDGKGNFGVLNYLARDRKGQNDTSDKEVPQRSALISQFLDSVIEENLSEYLKINSADNVKRTFLHYVALFESAEAAHKIYCDYRSKFDFSLDLKDKGDESVQDIFDTTESRLTKAVKVGDFDTFKREIDQAFQAVSQGEGVEKINILPNTFQPDAMGMSFIHSLSLVKDANFIGYVLELYQKDDKAFKEITQVEDLTLEMNRVHEMSKLTPIMTILSNGQYENVKTILENIVDKRAIKIDINQKDSRHRNILHCLFYNRNLQLKEMIELHTWILKMNDSMIHSAHSPSLNHLYSHIDKDGFLPISMFVSKIKPETQDEEEYTRMFELLVDKTDFENILTNPKKPSLVHPLIQCIKGKLDVYFTKYLEISSVMKTQVIYIEKTTRRSTIEYAFDSELPEFMEPILKALTRIDSFILDTSSKSCITLFDVFFNVLQNARHSHVFVLSRDEIEPKHPMVQWIRRLSKIIYEETRDKMNTKAPEFLKGFEYMCEVESEEIDIPKPKIPSKMPARLKQKILDDYNAKVQAAKDAQAEKNTDPTPVNNTSMILDKAYEINDYFSFPYLFEIVGEMKSDKYDLQFCLTQRKHIDIFYLIFSHCLKHRVAIPEGEFVINVIVDDPLSSYHIVNPSLDIEKFYRDLHHKLQELPGVELTNLVILQWIQAIDANYNGFVSQHRVPFVKMTMSWLDSLQIQPLSKEEGKTRTVYSMCIEPLLDLIVKHNIPLSIDRDDEQISCISKTFQKLLFVHNYKYVLFLQKLALELAKNSYQQYKDRFKVFEESQKGTKFGSEDSETEYEYAGGFSNADLANNLISNLKGLTSFDCYQQLDFCEDPENILKVIKGFVILGGYAFINVGYSDQTSAPETRAEFKRVHKMVEEFKTSSCQSHFGCDTLLHFFCIFSSYNDLAFELFDTKSPLTFIIDVVNNKGLNLFEFALDRNNVELAMKMIESCEISKVISCFPLQKLTLKNLLSSSYVVKFLTCISENKHKIESLVVDSEEKPYLVNLPGTKSAVEDVIDKGLVRDKQHDEDESELEYMDENNSGNVVYAFYQRKYVIEKLGDQIPYFNLLFFDYDRYALDELVKVLKVSEIKALNAQGYVIGHIFSHGFDRPKFIEL